MENVTMYVTRTYLTFVNVRNVNMLNLPYDMFCDKCVVLYEQFYIQRTQ
jgi:hypothetical protein